MVPAHKTKTIRCNPGDGTLYSSCCVGCKLCVGMRVCIWAIVGASWGKGGWGITPRGKPGGSFWSSSCISVLWWKQEHHQTLVSRCLRFHPTNPNCPHVSRNTLAIQDFHSFFLLASMNSWRFLYFNYFVNFIQYYLKNSGRKILTSTKYDIPLKYSHPFHFTTFSFNALYQDINVIKKIVKLWSYFWEVFFYLYKLIPEKSDMLYRTTSCFSSLTSRNWNLF